MVHLDNEVVTKLSQPLDTNITLNQLSGLITHRGPKSIIVADSHGEGIPHYVLNYPVFKLCSVAPLLFKQATKSCEQNMDDDAY